MTEFGAAYRQRLAQCAIDFDIKFYPNFSSGIDFSEMAEAVFETVSEKGAQGSLQVEPPLVVNVE